MNNIKQWIDHNKEGLKNVWGFLILLSILGVFTICVALYYNRTCHFFVSYAYFEGNTFGFGNVVIDQSGSRVAIETRDLWRDEIVKSNPNWNVVILNFQRIEE